MTKLGHSLDAVQYPPEMGGVSFPVFYLSSSSNDRFYPYQGYLAYLESAHQLHCLQALWEDHHFAKYPHLFPGLAEKLRTQPNITEYHYEHCVDVIRNRLMCTADSQLVTFRWVEGVSGPYPYFNTKHTCNNYEALLEWDQSRWADKEMLEGYGWHPPNDAVKLKKAP
jgi:Mycotoxin biosynthesis protein UstYa